MRTKIFNRLGIPLITLFTVGALLVGLASIGNSFRFEQRSVTVPRPMGNLDGVLTLPSEGVASGLVVMIHGDGPVDATQGGLYSPWFEGAADAGFATLSWSKPGVGGSAGDWRAQSMQDRADEAVAAIEWARAQPDVPTDKIVLWGASQAGWVLPKITRDREDIDGVVAVGTAINWLRQGRYNLLAELDHGDASSAERAQAIAESDETLALLARGASYQEYFAATADAEPMTEARWGFVLRNFESDADADLAASAARPIPVQLMIGTEDRNVDVAETEASYRASFGSELTVSRADGAHSLAKPVMEDNEFVGFVTGVFWPRALLAPGVIHDYTTFLASIAPRE